jgi:hypothetical protein
MNNTYYTYTYVTLYVIWEYDTVCTMLRVRTPQVNVLWVVRITSIPLFVCFVGVGLLPYCTCTGKVYGVPTRIRNLCVGMLLY